MIRSWQSSADISHSTHSLAYSPRIDQIGFYEKNPDIGSYKPSCPHNANLRKIVLEVDLPGEFEKPLLDFSGVPEATIRATFYLGVEYKMHIPVGTRFPWYRIRYDSHPLCFVLFQ